MNSKFIEANHSLSTERLYLKSITPGLIHELFNIKKKEEIMSYFGFGEADFEKYKSMHEKGMETYATSLFYFLLIDKQNNKPIGECGFHNWNKTHNRAELFYLLRNDSDKQKGYMSEVLPVILDFGFKELTLHRIEAFVANWNLPSVKLLQRNGFTMEGTLREDYCVDGKNEDSDCYSLLSWEWKK